jgi:hypothetical protein
MHAPKEMTAGNVESNIDGTVKCNNQHARECPSCTESKMLVLQSLAQLVPVGWDER